MATQNQIDPNRHNALKSTTSPRTLEGKAVVALTPLRNGLRARTVVLPTENRQEFHRLCDDLEAEWQPRSRTEQFYLEQMAVSQWKLTRLEVGEINVFKKDGDQISLLDRLWQAQCRLERSYARAQRELERLQAARRHQLHQPAKAAVEHTVSPARPAAAFAAAAATAAAVGQAVSPAQSPPADIAPVAAAATDQPRELVKGNALRDPCS
jgi:hypothetical protein